MLKSREHETELGRYFVINGQEKKERFFVQKTHDDGGMVYGENVLDFIKITLSKYLKLDGNKGWEEKLNEGLREMEENGLGQVSWIICVPIKEWREDVVEISLVYFAKDQAFTFSHPNNGGISYESTKILMKEIVGNEGEPKVIRFGKILLGS